MLSAEINERTHCYVFIGERVRKYINKNKIIGKYWGDNFTGIQNINPKKFFKKFNHKAIAQITENSTDQIKNKIT